MKVLCTRPRRRCNGWLRVAAYAADRRGRGKRGLGGAAVAPIIAEIVRSAEAGSAAASAAAWCTPRYRAPARERRDCSRASMPSAIAASTQSGVPIHAGLPP